MGIARGIVMVWLMCNHVAYGEEYLMSVVKDAQDAHVFVYNRSSSDWVQVQSLPQRRAYMDHLTLIDVPISLRTTEGIENKSLRVQTSDDSFPVFGGYSYVLFSLLPIPALGPKYTVSSCHLSGPNVISVLVIGTHRQRTSVDITFRLQGNVVYEGRVYRNGDTLSVNLEEYQTFTIKSSFDLSGSVISATQTVAVFSGTMVSSMIEAYEQLLPIKHYGQEYIVAVDDNPSLYKLQIVSEQSDTQIMFKNGSTVSLGESGMYSQTLTHNGRLHFSSTSPVMATLCRRNGINSGFTVVPPVELYVKHTAFHWYDTFKVLTDKGTDSIKVTKLNTPSIPGQWNEIPGSGYKVGTWTGSGYTSVVAESTFTVLVFRDRGVYNGGYNFSTSHICAAGHYGPDCIACASRHCEGVSSCSLLSGRCDRGCQTRWIGTDCRECYDNYYGNTCSLPCTDRHCFGISSCNHVTGSCDNGCDPGWKGQDCTEECYHNHYGNNCSLPCTDRHCFGISTCNHVTGSCDNGCDPGWKGQDCTEECDNHYGDNCSFPCIKRHCFGISTCNHVTGSCDNGCDPGWKEQDCSEVCDREYYGANCSKLCGARHCEGGSACNSTTGQCDRGCQAGWMGTDCTEPSQPWTTVTVTATTSCVLVIALAVLVGVVVWRKRRGRPEKTVSDQVVFKDSTASITPAIGNEYDVPDRSQISSGFVNAQAEYTEIDYQEDRSHKNNFKEVSTTAAAVPPYDSDPTYENLKSGGQNVYENVNKMG